VNLDVAAGIRGGGLSTKVKETARIDLARENPFWTIWFRPRATIRGIVETNPTLHVLPLAIVGGILQVVQSASQQNFVERLSIPAIALVGVLVGPPLGLFSLYVGAWFAVLTCRLFGGQADAREVRAALAWSTVPLLATIPIWLIQLAVLGREVFTSGLVSAARDLPTLVPLIWFLVTTVKTLGEVQRFSAWRAFGSLVLLHVGIIALMVLIGIAVVAYIVLKNLSL
jgi:Yip1 domain